MNKKIIIKFIAIDVLIMVIISVIVSLYISNKNKYNFEYKRFKFFVPESIKYETDDYLITFTQNDGSIGKVDIIIDYNSDISQQPEKYKDFLNSHGYIVEEGPKYSISSEHDYFYYKVNHDSRNIILAYLYSNLSYVFEVEYSNENGYEDLTSLENILNILAKYKYDDNPNNKYIFHYFDKKLYETDDLNQ